MGPKSSGQNRLQLAVNTLKTPPDPLIVKEGAYTKHLNLLSLAFLKLLAPQELKPNSAHESDKTGSY